MALQRVNTQVVLVVTVTLLTKGGLDVTPGGLARPEPASVLETEG